jgi:hypothetical protein
MKKNLKLNYYYLDYRVDNNFKIPFEMNKCHCANKQHHT